MREHLSEAEQAEFWSLVEEWTREGALEWRGRDWGLETTPAESTHRAFARLGGAVQERTTVEAWKIHRAEGEAGYGCWLLWEADAEVTPGFKSFLKNKLLVGSDEVAAHLWPAVELAVLGFRESERTRQAEANRAAALGALEALRAPTVAPAPGLSPLVSLGALKDAAFQARLRAQCRPPERGGGDAER